MNFEGELFVLACIFFINSLCYLSNKTRGTMKFIFFVLGFLIINKSIGIWIIIKVVCDCRADKMLIALDNVYLMMTKFITGYGYVNYTTKFTI